MLAAPFVVLVLSAVLLADSQGQRITTIQLEGVQYFVSRMNPYSPELNYFLAYQFCRSIGLQLASFETKEKSQAIMDYLTNAGYNKYDFWTSGNSLGTDMLIWMSTGLPFNATFDLMRKKPGEESMGPVARQLSAVEQKKDSSSADGCVALKAPDLLWDTDDCQEIKDFICEQTRCYYYNYGSIPVSSAQGRKYRPKVTTASVSATTTVPSVTAAPTTTTTTTKNSDSEKSTTVEATTIYYAEAEEASETANDPITSLPLKGRTLRTEEPEAEGGDSPWSWARNIMLEKPVLKKSSI